MIFQLLVRDGKEWCMDVFDKFVGAGDSVCLGEAVIRRYQVWIYITIRVVYQEIIIKRLTNKVCAISEN